MRTAPMVAVLLIVVTRQGAAQTDYYNTDAGRPIRIEDASPVEYHALDLQLAPLRLERHAAGAYQWELEPEIAWGALPNTQLELGVSVRYADGPAGGTLAAGGITLGILHSLNTETALPALAIAADATLPVGAFGADRTYASVKGIATKSFPFARFHANAQVTLGAEPAAGDRVGETSRWMAGLAVDRTLPLKSLLMTADLFAEQPIRDGSALGWTAEAGFRYQTSPQFNVDAGVGRAFAGDEQGWFLTVGFAHTFSLRALMGTR